MERTLLPSLSQILGGFLLIFAFSYEASSKRTWTERNFEGEDGGKVETSSISKAAKISEFKYDFFGNRSGAVINMYTKRFRNKALQNFVNFDKKEIDKLMNMNYDVLSSGIWDELIQMNNYAGIKYLLTDYFFDKKTRRQAFRDSIIHGATSLAKFILDKFKLALRSNNLDFVHLACENKRYKILRMMASIGIFNVNYSISIDAGKCVLHHAVIGNDFRLVKILLKFKDVKVNCIDDFRSTPLHYATDVEIIKILLKHGADAFQLNRVGLDPVSAAVKLKRTDLVQAMIPDLVLRFDHFHIYYRKSKLKVYQGTFILNRQRILEDSFYLTSREDKWLNIKYNFDIEFEGESGVDHGGLTREWMSLLIERFFVPRLPDESSLESSENESENEEMNDSDNDSSAAIEMEYLSDEERRYSLMRRQVPSDKIEKYFYSPFECVDVDNKLYRISSKFTGPVEVYNFIGSILAKSILSKNPLKVKLVPSILKLLIGKTLIFEDLKDDDLVMYKSMLHCLEPDFDFESAFYTFPNDESVTVDAGNVELFLNETAVNAMYTRYKDQIDQLIQGFRTAILHEKLRAYFLPEELQNILKGADSIDRVDLYKNIQILGPNWILKSQIFWSAMDLLQEGELIELVRFITGINGMPFGGVSSLGKQLKIFDEIRNSVPKASTCNYHLSLPISVQSAEELVELFRIAISSEPEFIDCAC